MCPIKLVKNRVTTHTSENFINTSFNNNLKISHKAHLDYGDIIYGQANNFPVIIVNRPRNGYETVGNIMDNFKQLEVANKVDYVTN